MSENANLLCGVLSSHTLFEDLGTFTLAKGLREIRRIQEAREDQTRRPDTHDRTLDDSSSASREKTRLMENESNNSTVTPTRQVDVSTPTLRQSEDLEDAAPSSAAPSTPGNISDPERDLSEKARGKMKERRPSSLDMSPNLERLAAAGIGRNGFVPTQEWVSEILHRVF